jgi:GT2 family glycosyltransferase
MMRPGHFFNAEFFLYCEDTELCVRLREEGEILYVPSAVFRHELGASSTQNRWVSVARYNRGKEIYFRIHYGRFAAVVAWCMNRAGASLRLVLWLIPCLFSLGLVSEFRSRVALFTRVLFAPISGPPEG